VHEAKIDPGVVFHFADASSLDNLSGDSIRIVAGPISSEQERRVAPITLPRARKWTYERNVEMHINRFRSAVSGRNTYTVGNHDLLGVE
jgi:hypothetical protein